MVTAVKHSTNHKKSTDIISTIVATPPFRNRRAGFATERKMSSTFPLGVAEKLINVKGMVEINFSLIHVRMRIGICRHSYER